MAAAAAQAGRVGLLAAAAGSVGGGRSSEESCCKQARSRAHVAFSARSGIQTRLVAISGFFGSAIHRSVLRAANGSAPWTVANVVSEVAVEGTSNSTTTKVEVPSSQDELGPGTPSASATSIETAASLFMTDVANLIKLVDTRDVVELELKQKGYELVIRKQDALPLPPVSQQMSSQGPHVMAHTMFPGYQLQPQTQVQSNQEAPAPPPMPAPVPDPIPVAAEHPPMLSPMAGTFYRSPAPGEPQFVKVGDRVTKGQVVCIVEAMKLMNEIEADQSGIIVEVVAEDGKPVSIESPLFIIKP